MKEDKGERRALLTLPLDCDINTISQIDSVTHIIVRKRTNAIELDLASPSLTEVLDTIERITKIVDCREIEKEERPAEAQLQNLRSREKEIMELARSLFDEERYWEAHTVLEDLWKVSQGEKKKFLQTLILIAASLVHYQTGEPEIAEKMYKKALSMLKDSPFSSVIENMPSGIEYPMKFPLKMDSSPFDRVNLEK